MNHDFLDVLPEEVKMDLTCIVKSMDESADGSEALKKQMRRDLAVELLSSALDNQRMDIKASVDIVMNASKSSRNTCGKSLFRRIIYSSMYKTLLRLLAFLFCVLALYEESYSGQWNDKERYAHRWTNWVECCILFIVFCHIIVHRVYSQRGRWGFLFTFLWLIFSADLVAHMTLSNKKFSLPRLSRPLRPLLLASLFHTYRYLCTSLIKVVPRILPAIVMIVIIMLGYAVWGVQAFSDKFTQRCYELGGKGLENFHSLGHAALAVFVLLSEENYPYIMYPAQLASPYHAFVYFTSFLVIMLFLLIPLLLALTYSQYKINIETEFEKEIVRKHLGMLVAFHVLQDTPYDADNSSTIPFDVWADIVMELRPNIAQEDLILMASSIRQSNDEGHLSARRPLNLREVLQTFTVLPLVRSELRNRKRKEASHSSTLSAITAGLSPSVVPLSLRDFSDDDDDDDDVFHIKNREKRSSWPYCRKYCCCCLPKMNYNLSFLSVWKLFIAIINTVAICNLRSPEVYGASSNAPISYMTMWICLLVHVSESVVVLSWLCSKVSIFRKRVSLRLYFETTVTITSLFAEVAGTVLLGRPVANLYVMAALAITRGLRVLRLLTVSNYFDSMWSAIRVAVPVLLTLSMVWLSLTYSYIIVGLELFGALAKKESAHGVVDDLRPFGLSSPSDEVRLGHGIHDLHKYNELDAATDFVTEQHRLFSGFWPAAGLLWQLTVSNNWQDIMHPNIDGTNQYLSWYFTSYYWLCHMFLLDVIIGVMLDAVMTLDEEDSDKKRRKKNGKLQERKKNRNGDDDATLEDRSSLQEKEPFMGLAVRRKSVGKVFQESPRLATSETTRFAAAAREHARKMSEDSNGRKWRSAFGKIRAIIRSKKENSQQGQKTVRVTRRVDLSKQ
eukprot:g1585.t1